MAVRQMYRIVGCQVATHRRKPMKQEFYVFVQCAPGKTYEAGLRIAKKHNALVASISSVSGDWDLLLRLIMESGHDVGKELAGLFAGEADVVRTNTVVSFPIFDPRDIFFDEEGDV
jgi:hypothetical protein